MKPELQAIITTDLHKLHKPAEAARILECIKMEIENAYLAGKADGMKQVLGVKK